MIGVVGGGGRKNHQNDVALLIDSKSVLQHNRLIMKRRLREFDKGKNRSNNRNVTSSNDVIPR